MAYQTIIDHTKVNYTKGNTGRKYIVLHYTGNSTDTAKANANYFRDVNRGASAHYFVDASSVYEVVSPANTAWAVGRNFGTNNLFGKCTNGNSISIEMCSAGGKIGDTTLANAVELTKSLMLTYGIPAANVVRHWDVCSKRCPGWSGWLPGNDSLWQKFKATIQETPKPAPKQEPTPEQKTDFSNKKGNSEMQCTYNIDGGSTIFWFDGQKIHKLTHPDQLKIIRQIYKANNGIDMPNYNWSSKAPWYTRLQQAIDCPAK